MGECIDNIVYRDFKDEDIDELSILLASVWYPETSGECALLVGKIDLSYFLKLATYVRVAVFNDEIVGIAAIRAGEATADNFQYWAEISEKSISELDKESPEAADFARNYYAFEDATNKRLLEESNIDDNFELRLFAVSDKARGRGVGSELLRQVVNCLKDKGAKSFFLYTDTSCNWQYYENRGLKREASYQASDSEFQEFGIEELYVYSCRID